MSAYTFTVLTNKIIMKANAWVDDIDVDATIVYGLRNSDGTAITNGTSSVSVDSLAPILYSDELDISSLGLIDGQRYDLFIELQVARVSASPSPSILNAHMEVITLSGNALSNTDKSFTFQSQATGSDEVFYGGGYNMFSGNNDFSPLVNFGSANVSYAAHFFIVLGETPDNEITIGVTGTSITDTGVRTIGDVENIVVPASASINDYFETSKKWLGTVAVLVTGGTEKQCNYGYSKYWDNNNEDFTVLGWDTTWFSGAGDDVDMVVYHHKATGWTYNVGAEPSPPELGRMTDDHTTTDDKVISGAFCAWKRSNIDQMVQGSVSEGLILSAISSKASSFQIGNTIVKLRA